MKILHISYSNDKGGAAKACLRMHRGLREAQIDSNILTVLRPNTPEEGVECYAGSNFGQAVRQTKKIINLIFPIIFQKTTNQELHTFDIVNTISPKYINNSDADIIHLHWVNFSALSIKAISKIKKPMVWTFHDMWAFMGCEHYDTLDSMDRYTAPYTKQNKNVKGIDFNKIAWNLKKKYWKNINFEIIALSTWMKDCVQKSELLKNAKINQVPNIIEEDKFYKKDKKEARKNLGLDLEKKYILFGAYDITSLNKGGDLLHKALKTIDIPNTEILIFGGDKSQKAFPIPTKYFGYIREEAVLNDLYNAADVFIVPSRQDNLPNTVLESMRCGTPVVGFEIGGMPDMILHKQTGYLAKPFDTDDLKKGIEHIIYNKDKVDFSEKCIEQSNNKFSKNVVIPQLLEVYNKIMQKNKK